MWVRFWTRIGWAAALAIALMNCAADRADTIYDSTKVWDGIDSLASFGPPNTETYGEHITAPTDGDDLLKSFTFFIDVSSTIQFQGEVYAWNGTGATGSSLWQGPLVTLNPTSGFVAETFNTGGVTLQSGQQYVLFASTSNGAQTSGSSAWGFVFQQPVAGSGYTILNSGASSSNWTSEAWSAGKPEMAFKADFANGLVMPLPLTCYAGASLLVGVALTKRLKGRKLAPESLGPATALQDQ